jgi:hypothetical protein
MIHNVSRPIAEPQRGRLGWDLQELKAPGEKLPVAPIRATGYGAIWHEHV